MSTSDQKAAGTPAYVDVAGQKYRMSPLTPADFAEAKAFFRRQFPDPMTGLAEKIKDLPIEVQKEIALRAYEDSKRWGDIHTPEGMRWASSLEGTSFFFWLAIRSSHESITHDEIHSKFKELAQRQIDELMATLDNLTGLAEDYSEIKKSTGLAKSERKRRKQVLEKALKAARQKTTGKR